MLTKARPPDRLASAGQDSSPAGAAPGEPPGPAGEAGLAVPPGPAGVAEETVWSEPRVVALPGGWPPYDCEIHGAACHGADPQADRLPTRPATAADQAATTGTAEADLDQGAGLDQAPGRVAAASWTPSRGGDAGYAPGLSASWPGQFAQALVEILAGFRPAKQLAPWTTERVRAQVDLLSCAVAAEQRPRIRRVMTSRPTAGVVEMTMVVSFGSRSRALAIRFEHVPARPATPGRPARPARWLCTEIETS
ncbi:MAG: Rv3235 family protein [Streptosporangiaceae bacterium]|jgi:Family of unknown function (DUF6459)